MANWPRTIDGGNLVRVIYMRVARGADDEAAQRDIISAASGATPEELDEAWVDRITRKPSPGEPRFPQRDYMTRALRRGDEVWVARPGVLGTDEQDVLGFVAALTEAGAILRVASTGMTYRGESVASALTLVRDIKADERAMVMAKARKAPRKARESEFAEAAWNAARLLWPDASVTAEDVAAKTGISVRHLYREFGPRGTPAFGRPPKKKGRKR